MEQTPDEQEDEQPPELVFMHGGTSYLSLCFASDLKVPAGHTARPTDFCWAPGEQETWTCASASEDNVVMVWAPSMRVWAGEEIKVEEAELEQPMEGVEEESASASAGGEKEAVRANGSSKEHIMEG